jgi:sigma-B regulation protein RsbU (phosphoserine phosphatase)
MSAPFSSRLRFVWDAASRPDRVALLVAVLYAAVWMARDWGLELPFSGLIGFFFVLASIYGVFRVMGIARRHLLWSLRNRLIVAYVFIAVVPILLLLTMAALSGYIMYSQLGAYIFNREMQATLTRLESLADTILVASPAGGRDGDAKPGRALKGPGGDAAQMLIAAEAQDLPGLEAHWNQGAELLPAPEPGSSNQPKDRRFSGLFQESDKIWLRVVVARSGPRGEVVESVSVPFRAELLERIAPQLGVIQLSVLQPVDSSSAPDDKRGFRYATGGRTYRNVAGFSTVRRNLAPPVGWWDREVTGFSKLDATMLEEAGARQTTLPVFVFFSARPSELSRHLFSSLGDLNNVPFQVLLIVGVLFLVIEAGALFVGVRITRSITASVADLYRATEHVQKGDFSYRIRSERKDQLGELGNSFNTMTISVASAIEEQRRRERLENELAIAHEVQAQLFPRERPSLPGLEVAAECRAARTVSGDYYDFIPLSKTELGLIVADIAGKGISAALLMASLQAALRSQFLEKGSGARSTAEVVKRLNRHLFVASPEDRYATLFFAIYDSSSRVMRYTNAGHLPPMCFAPDGIIKLEDGGTVVGMFEDCEYDQGRITIAPGSLVVIYTDGLVEPENAYGEEFGRKRLAAEVARHRQARLEVISDAVMSAVEDWAGTPERADDMTLLLASVT